MSTSNELKSAILKADSVLVSIANGNKAKKAYSTDSTTTDSSQIGVIQNALIKLGCYLKPDNDFGGLTKGAVKWFQSTYPQKKNIHVYTMTASNPDGVVGKNTLLAIDEALVNGWTHTLRSGLLKVNAELESSASGKTITVYKDEGAYSKNTQIELLQKALKSLGFTVGVDGKFGPGTGNAVKHFQSSYSAKQTIHTFILSADTTGSIGRHTLKAIDEALVLGWKYSTKVTTEDATTEVVEEEKPAVTRIITRYPITKKDGSEFKDDAEIEAQLKKEERGAYGFAACQKLWHGGIHLTQDNATWAYDQHPVRAIADGKVIAARLPSDYITAESEGRAITYSNGFCLLKHTVKDDNSDEIFTFYSHYMHIKPVNELATTSYKAAKPVQVFSAKPSQETSEYTADDNKVIKITLSDRILLERTAEEAVQGEIGKDSYYFASFTIVNGYKNTNLSVGSTVWAAVGKSTENDKLNNLEIFTKESETQYTLKAGKNVRTRSPKKIEFSSDVKKVTLEQGALLEPTPEASVKGFIGTDEYYFSPYTVIDNKGNKSASVTPGKTVWLAVGQSSKADLIDSILEYAVPFEWMANKITATLSKDQVGRTAPQSKTGESGYNLAGIEQEAFALKAGTQITFSRYAATTGLHEVDGKPILLAQCQTDNTDVTEAWLIVAPSKITLKSAKLLESDQLHGLSESAAVDVKAGDPISYLSRSVRVGPIKTEEGQLLHLEAFALEQPKEFFLRKLYGDEIAAKIKSVEGEGSSGYFDMAEPSDFFETLAKASGKKPTETELTPQQVLSTLKDWDSSKHCVIQHESEWFDKGDDKAMLKILEEKYPSKPFQALLEREKGRIDELAWMNDAEVQLLKLQKYQWYFWPLVLHMDSSVINWADSAFGTLLGKVESNNDYSAYNKTLGRLRGFFNTDLNTLTLKEVRIRQSKRDMFAVGRFQMIPGTLSDAVKYLKIDEMRVFDKKLQDQLFNDYLISVKRPKIMSYLSGDGDVSEAMYEWAKEFASAGVEKGRGISKKRIAKGGESYYSGDGFNKAHISPEEMKAILIKSKR